VGLLQGGQSRFLAVAQAVEAAQRIPVEELGKGLFGALGNLRSGRNQPPRAPDIPQSNPAELMLGPNARFSDKVHKQVVSP
jgi:hypothetical protein